MTDLKTQQAEFMRYASEEGWKIDMIKKNSYMISFLKGKARINYYVTTGTLTYQRGDWRDLSHKTETIKNATMEDLKRLINI